MNSQQSFDDIGLLLGNHPLLTHELLSRLLSKFNPRVCFTLNLRFKDAPFIDMLSQRTSSVFHLFTDPLLICHELTNIYNFSMAGIVEGIYLPEWVKELNVFNDVPSTIYFYNARDLVAVNHSYSAPIALKIICRYVSIVVIFGIRHEYENAQVPSAYFISDSSNSSLDYPPAFKLEEGKIWSRPNPQAQEIAFSSVSTELLKQGCTIIRCSTDDLAMIDYA